MNSRKYPANWVRLIDSNTIILNVDLGLHTNHVGPFQLKDVPATASKEALEGILLRAGDLTAETFKPDKYGRWLVVLWYTDEKGKLVSINAELTSS